MAIVNRDVDVSDQKFAFHKAFDTEIANGATAWVAIVPFPCTVQSARAVANGVSGTPQLIFRVHRFAAGETRFSISASNLVLGTMGTSGVVGYSGLLAAGSTLLNLVAGDVLTVEGAVTNSSSAKLAVSIVVKKTQDIVSYFGVST